MANFGLVLDDRVDRYVDGFLEGRGRRGANATGRR